MYTPLSWGKGVSVQTGAGENHVLPAHRAQRAGVVHLFGFAAVSRALQQGRARDSVLPSLAQVLLLQDEYYQVEDLPVSGLGAPAERSLRDFDRADEALELAPELTPGSLEARVVVARLNAERGAAEFPGIYFLLGSASLMLGELEQAARYAGNYRGMHPGSIRGRKLLAVIRLQQGDFAAVEPLFI